MAVVRFYSPKAPYYEFSNFYESTFELDGQSWRTVEHYFQASKFDCKKYAEVIRTSSTANKAFILGGQKKRGGYAGKWPIDPKNDKRSLNDVIDLFKSCKIREDWDAAKFDAMKRALYAKFSQNEKLKALLLSTGDATIVEDSPRDAFWGVGKDGKGCNELGKLLEKTRAKLSR